jgi:hypothetical protein
MDKLDKALGFIGWIKIFLSPFLGGLVLCLILLLNSNGLIWKAIGVMFFIGGIVGGVLLANKAANSIGTQETLNQLKKAEDWDELTKGMREQEKNK